MKSSLTILIVTDSKSDYKTVCTEIEKHSKNYNLIHAANFEALVAQKVDAIFAVVADYAIQSTSIIKVLSYFNEATHKKPVIVYSSSNTDKIPDEVFKLGAVDYMDMNKLPRLYYSIEKERVQFQFEQDMIKLKKDYKAFEHSLEEQNYLIKQLIEASSNPIFYKNSKGIYLECNKAFSEFIGKSKKEINFFSQ